MSKKPVRVMFSDGSRDMAHNTDDLFERWMVRRTEATTEELRINPYYEIEIFLPNLPTFETQSEAQRYLNLLKFKRDYLNKRLDEMRQSFYTNFGYMKKEALVYAVQRATAHIKYLEMDVRHHTTRERYQHLIELAQVDEALSESERYRKVATAVNEYKKHAAWFNDQKREMRERGVQVNSDWIPLDSKDIDRKARYYDQWHKE